MAAYPPTARQILNRLGSPHMPAADVRFALLTRPNHFGTKPVAFDSVDKLAASLHRRRNGRAVLTINAPLRFDGETADRQGVSVWALGPDGEQSDYLGWCWLDGLKRRDLQAALDAQVRDVQPYAEAA